MVNLTTSTYAGVAETQVFETFRSQTPKTHFAFRTKFSNPSSNSSRPAFTRGSWMTKTSTTARSEDTQDRKLKKPYNLVGQLDRLTEHDAWPSHEPSGRSKNNRHATKQNRGQLDVARPLS